MKRLFFRLFFVVLFSIILSPLHIPRVYAGTSCYCAEGAWEIRPCDDGRSGPCCDGGSVKCPSGGGKYNGVCYCRYCNRYVCSNPTPTATPTPRPPASTPTPIYCDMGTCPAGYYCYQPPMPTCPPGVNCTQAMPRRYCRVGPSPIPTPNCSYRARGDANCDGLINDTDYGMWSSHLKGNAYACQYCSVDFNRDTIVNVVDYEIWRMTRYN